MTKIYILGAILLLLLVILFISRRRILGFQGSEGFSSGGELLIVKAAWCGHCKKAMPDFEKLVQSSPVKLNDGSEITVRMLDESADSGEIQGLNVRGFPTILFRPTASAPPQEYSGPRTFDGVMGFLTSQ